MEDYEATEIEKLQQETEKFLSWTEEHKIGFTKDELDRHVEILEASLEENSLGEIIAKVRKDIELWVRVWWNHSKVGRTLDNGNRQSDRAEVIREFPQLLSDYLTRLSTIEQVELSEDEQLVADQIIERIGKSVEIFGFNGGEGRGRAVNKKKRPPRRQPRGNR